MYYNAPSAVGIAEFPAEEEDHVWSIRVFNAFDGFKDHFPVPVSAAGAHCAPQGREGPRD